MIRIVPFALLLAACSHGPQQAGGNAAPPQVDTTASFTLVRSVLQSPRCVNCHPSGDAPLQGDLSMVHAQNIQRGPEGRGMAGQECLACHGKANLPESYGHHMPPGVSTGWRLPPKATPMVFQGVGARALCEQLKDPQQNGGKDLAALVHHVAEDPLVLWGWSPGVGRAPVQVAHADFVAAFKSWADGGATCPP